MYIDIKQAVEFLKDNDYYHILAHVSPDGDTIGSCYALYYALKQMGKKSKVLCADEINNKYEYIFDDVPFEDFIPNKVIACDIADENLLGDLQQEYRGNIDLCLDHHLSNKNYAKMTLLDSRAAANCELIFRLIKDLNVTIDEKIAMCLYTGIVTDTGCFRFSNTTSQTHLIAAELLKINFSHYEINREMFEIKKMERMRLETMLITDMQSYFNHRCHIVIIHKKQMEELGLIDSDLEGINSITTQISGTLVGITIKEKPDNNYRLSLRSTGKVNVSEICQKFGGGGHFNAAGCVIKGKEEEVVKKIVEALSEVMTWGSVNAE
jgi:phosphoesterase RecJ-like protein